VNATHPRSRSGSLSDGAGEVARGIFVVLAQVLRIAIFAVLSTLEPLVRVVLSLIAFGGFLMCGFYALVAPHSHFPQPVMLSISAGAAVRLVLYFLLMRALAP
jgi:hypothetical protein